MAAKNDWIQARALLTPDKVALVDLVGARGRLSYRRWHEDVLRTARYLRDELGIKKGDRVALLSMNSVEWLDVLFACAKLGAVLQPLNWRLAVPELVGVVKDAEPAVLFYGHDFAPQALAVEPQCACLRTLIAMEDGGRASPSHRRLSERATLSDAPVELADVEWGDPWVLCYTGGTTGLPKGAVLTYGSITANAINTTMGWGIGGEDVALLDAPLFHAGGLSVFTAPLVFAGGTSYVARSFSADRVIELVGQGALTLLFGVPTMFLAIQEHARWSEVDFARLKLVITGGAPCPPPIFEKFWARGVDFRMGYGLTEAGPNNFGMPGPEAVRAKPGSVGFPLPLVETSVVHEGRECGPDEVGELWLKGPHVAGGYFRKPDETKKTFVDGWVRTGDLVRRDAQGFFYIVGRAKELIISGGENIYPAEIEAVLTAHADVAEAMVIGLPDPKWGELPHAVIVAKPGVTPSAEALHAHCSERLARYKLPRSFRFVPALPRTAAGKVDRRQVVADASAAAVVK